MSAASGRISESETDCEREGCKRQCSSATIEQAVAAKLPEGLPCLMDYLVGRSVPRFRLTAARMSREREMSRERTARAEKRLTHPVFFCFFSFLKEKKRIPVKAPQEKHPKRGAAP